SDPAGTHLPLTAGLSAGPPGRRSIQRSVAWGGRLRRRVLVRVGDRLQARRDSSYQMDLPVPVVAGVGAIDDTHRWLGRLARSRGFYRKILVVTKSCNPCGGLWVEYPLFIPSMGPRAGTPGTGFCQPAPKGLIMFKLHGSPMSN